VVSDWVMIVTTYVVGNIKKQKTKLFCGFILHLVLWISTLKVATFFR
jgi:hypothetical protein